MLTMPMTAISLILKVSGKVLANKVTAIVHKANIDTHNNIDPSCPPHKAASLYMSGNCELEVEATYSTEKSLL